MPTRLNPTRSVLVALALLSGAAPLAAQRTHDQPRLVFSISPTYTLGADLWRVARQPILTGAESPDTFSLSRDVRPALGVSFQGAYYPHNNLGFVGEALLIGLGYTDGCHLAYSSGDPRIARGCSSIQGFEKSASAVMLSGGVMYRIDSRKAISPYVRAQVGMIVSNQSSIRTEGNLALPDSEEVALIVYPDQHSTRLTPALGVGIGFSAALGPGYQIHWEARDNLVGIATVTGPTDRDGVNPPSKTAYKHLFSISIGFDLVLERRRGRRY
jgi:hypothetical protein